MSNVMQSSRFAYLVLATAAAIAASVARPVSAQIVKLPAAAGAADDELGHAVAIDGSTAVVGAPGDDAAGADVGSASVFLYNGTSWALQQKLVPTGASAGSFFGSAVAVAGDIIAIGAYGDGSAGFAGAVYLWKRSGSTWSQSQKLTPSDAAASKFFGYSVALSADTLLIGATGDATQGSGAGAAYVFAPSGASFVQQQKLLASDGSANADFGISVALSGTTLLVGASGDTDDGVGNGSAYVFIKTGATFLQQQELTASSGSLNDYFGAAVALSGDVALIGALADDARGSDAGAAYVFQRSGSSWTQSQKLLASDGTAGDYFGFSVALQGSSAIIGASNDDDGGSAVGSAYDFRVSSSLTQRSKLHASDPAAAAFFGYAVAVSGSMSAIGANGKDSNAGAAYAYAQPPTASVPALGLVFVLALALALLTFGALRSGRRPEV